ncbi:MAG: hypothetical protein IPJ61_04755 [Tessaracoccus sp.]|nr:hypothetical protein [Tessaracoccus sp.]MBK7820387.1 hypothetical protein [Tessaracoccus sp.]
MPAAYADQLVWSLGMLARLREAEGSDERAAAIRAKADVWRPPEDNVG